MDTLITVKTYTYAHEAEIACSRLESAGIDCFLKDEFAIQINPFMSNALGGVKVQVRSVDASMAAGILERYERPDEDEVEPIDPSVKTYDPVGEDKNVIHCPFCGSTEVGKQRRPSGWGFVLSIFTLGFPLPFFKRDHHCYNCGKDFG